MNARSSAAGSNGTRSHSPAKCCRSTDSSWRACPKVNSRNRVPMVDGAYTPSKRVVIPPERTTSTSSMQSAPAHIPAITVVSFGAGLADPDLILGSAIWTFSANSPGTPVCVASVITGTSPAHDTRCSSSNTADAAMKLCDTCTGSDFPNVGKLKCGNSNHPSSEGTFFISTPRTPHTSSVDRGLGLPFAAGGFSGIAAAEAFGLAIAAALAIWRTYVGFGSIALWAVPFSWVQLGALGTFISRAPPLLIITVVGFFSG